MTRNIVAKRLPNFEYNENPIIVNVIFICGLHRSGTSLLENLIIQNLELSYLRMQVPENEGQHAQSVYSPAYKFGGPGRFAFSSAMDDELQKLNDYESCNRRIKDDWARFVVGHDTSLIEKSPPNITKIWWLRRVFPNSKFVVLSRDPRATSGATCKWTSSTIEELMMHWNVAYSKALADSRKEDTLWLRYEDVVADHQTALDAISSFAGLSRRVESQKIDQRFETLASTNDKYISMHSCKRYGRGVWNLLGYNV